MLIASVGDHALWGQAPQMFKGELKKDAKKKLFELKQTYTVKLDEGKEYLIDMTSTAFDALVRLLDADGKEVAANDDGGQDRNARLGVVPKKSGDYQIVATSFGERWAGPYEVTVKSIKKVGEPVIKKGNIDAKSPRLGNRFPAHSIKIDLDKGKLYKLDLDSKDFDPALLIYKHSSDLLAGDKDGGGDKNARLYFMPPSGGAYDLKALIQLPALAKAGEKIAYGEFTLTIQQYEFVEK
jgi:hypothetical protein